MIVPRIIDSNWNPGIPGVLAVEDDAIVVLIVGYVLLIELVGGTIRLVKIVSGRQVVMEVNTTNSVVVIPFMVTTPVSTIHPSPVVAPSNGHGIHVTVGPPTVDVEGGLAMFPGEHGDSSRNIFSPTPVDMVFE